VIELELRKKDTEPALRKRNWRDNKKYLYRALILSLCIHLLTACFFIGKRYYYSHAAAKIEKDSSYIAWKNSQTELLGRFPIDSNDIVFVGNSITQGFPTQEMFNNLDIKNRGIGYNNSFDILSRIDPIASGKPRKIFLLIGINDIMRDISSDSTIKNIHKIINTIETISPETKIYIQSVFPTSLDYENKMGKILRLNTKLKDFCEGRGLAFLNFHPAFITGNGLDTSMTYDGLHLKAKGYFVWKDLLLDYIYE
jgi:lysophospholipase L1-like esterase